MNNMLAAEERLDFRRSALHELREQGIVPSVVYGKDETSISVAVKGVDLIKVIKEVGRNGIISLDVNGNNEDVILADYQWNPINHEILHADFHHINMSTEIHAPVHVTLTGTAESVENGGVLQQSLHELNITAKPKDIPETIELDISNIKIGHGIKIGDIRKNYSQITINHDDDEVIVNVLPAKIADSTSDESEAEIEA